MDFVKGSSRLLLFAAVLCGVSACLELDRESPPTLVTRQAVEGVTGADQTPVVTSEGSLAPAQAMIVGIPETASTGDVSVRVDNVDSYAYKIGVNIADCGSDTPYSQFYPVSAAIGFDLVSIPDGSTVFLCVLGRKKGFSDQTVPTRGRMFWQPQKPVLQSQLSLVDAGDGVTVRMSMASESQGLVVRSFGPLTAVPKPGMAYDVFSSLGNGVVISKSLRPELVDPGVKRGSSVNYTVFLQSAELRYSDQLTAAISLPQQLVASVPQASLTAAMTPVSAAAPGATQALYICRTRYVDGSGIDRGLNPGHLIPNGTDLRTGRCRMEYGNGVFDSGTYDVLTINQGKQDTRVAWRPFSDFIPSNAIEYGSETGSDGTVFPFFSCRAYEDATRTKIVGVGKAGFHFGGCSFFNNQTGRADNKGFYDILSLN